MTRCRLEVTGDPITRDLRHEMVLPPGTALLYPGADAAELCSLPPRGRPAHLLLLDGTWPHARRMYRQNPWLRALPHVQITPSIPGRYRLRKEPSRHCRSTLEAVVAALEVLEPDTPGLDRLSRLLDVMIDDRLARMSGQDSGPHRRQRPRVHKPPPPGLAGRFHQLVVVYGEPSPLRVAAGEERPLLQWTAVRVAAAETFEQIITPAGRGLDDAHLARLGLTREQLAAGASEESFTRRWRAFRRSDDILAAWNQSTLNLIRAAADDDPTLMLKAAYCNLRRAACGALPGVIRAEGLRVEPPLALHGRAATRLGQAVAMARFLRDRHVGPERRSR